MIASAQVAHYARMGKKWGVNTSDVSVELPAIVARKNAVVQHFRDGQEHRVEKHPKLRLYRDVARFLSAKQVQVAEMKSSRAIEFSLIRARGPHRRASQELTPWAISRMSR